MGYSVIPPLLFLSLLPFIPLYTASNVTLGTSLSATSNNPSRVSPSGDFAFGFRKLNNTNIFLLAIWYAKIPDLTIVWRANTTTTVEAGSNIKLTANGLIVWWILCSSFAIFISSNESEMRCHIGLLTSPFFLAMAAGQRENNIVQRNCQNNGCWEGLCHPRFPLHWVSFRCPAHQYR